MCLILKSSCLNQPTFLFPPYLTSKLTTFLRNFPQITMSALATSQPPLPPSFEIHSTTTREIITTANLQTSDLIKPLPSPPPSPPSEINQKTKPKRVETETLSLSLYIYIYSRGKGEKASIVVAAWARRGMSAAGLSLPLSLSPFLYTYQPLSLSHSFPLGQFRHGGFDPARLILRHRRPVCFRSGIAFF